MRFTSSDGGRSLLKNGALVPDEILVPQSPNMGDMNWTPIPGMEDANVIRFVITGNASLHGLPHGVPNRYVILHVDRNNFNHLFQMIGQSVSALPQNRFRGTKTIDNFSNHAVIPLLYNGRIQRWEYSGNLG